MNTSYITDKAAQLGYTVVIEDGNIQYVFPANRDNFTPELFNPRNSFGAATQWTIQTSGYGPKTSEEIEQVVDGFKRAQQMVSYLENWGI